METKAQKQMREISKDVKTLGDFKIPTTLSQPPSFPHPDFNPDGSVKEKE